MLLIGNPGLLGNQALAARVMTRLGYSPLQIQAAGQDASNFQGVGCPHTRVGLVAGQGLEEALEGK